MSIEFPSRSATLSLSPAGPGGVFYWYARHPGVGCRRRNGVADEEHFDPKDDEDDDDAMVQLRHSRKNKLNSIGTIIKGAKEGDSFPA